MTDTPSKYIGVYTDSNSASSTSPSSYKWNKLVGDQGTPGNPGTNGKTSYLHIKYSNDGGKTFTASNGETVGTYIGTCTDYNSGDPTTVSSYTWAKIKGEQGIQGPQGVKGDTGPTGPQGPQGKQGIQGPQGVKGTDGKNGTSSYFHIAYANSSDGKTSFSVSDPSNRAYIGTYVDNTPNDSTDHTKYTWQLVKGAQGPKGDQGIKGVDGTNGKTSYLHIKYSNDGGKTFTASNGETVGTYIGTCTDYNSGDPTTVSSYTWAKIKGEQGIQGNTGPQGKQGIQGNTGPQGPQGKQGTTGPTGPQGPQGKQGNTGATGPQGPQGVKGNTGATGPQGATGKGVKSTAVTYQASASATSAPTGTWSGSPVTTSASLPYMWTRTIITYTDNATSTSYSVGCTPEGVSVGGRNLIRGSGKLGDDFAAGNGTAVTGGYNGNKAISTNGAWSGYYIHLKDIVNRAKIITGTTVTISIYVSTTSTTEVTTPAIYLYRGNGNEQTGAFGALKLIAGKWVKISKTYTITSAISNLLNTTRFEASGNTTFTILWSSPKLEIGNKATDWTPAPEDQVSKGDVVNQVNSELKISGNSIALTTGHFTISAKNMTLDSAGNATFSGTVKAASIEGSTITGGTISGTTITGGTITGAAGEFTKSFSVKIPYEEEQSDIGYWRIDFNGQNGFIGYKSNPATVIGIEFSNIGTHTAGGSIDKDYLRVNANDLCVDTRTIIRKDNYPVIYFSTETDCVVPQTDPVDGYTCGCIRYYKNNGHMEIISRNGLRIQDQNGYGYAMHGWDSGTHLYSCWWDGSALHFYVDKTNVWTSSDRRLKKDIMQIKDAYIEAVGKVDLVQYRLNRPGYHDNNIHFGAIAQDIVREFDNKGTYSDNLKMIFKDRIQINNPTLYYGMDYEQFLILRLAYNEKIIKQMQKEIAKLKGDKNENI